jgi:predicted outer membrane protein
MKMVATPRARRLAMKTWICLLSALFVLPIAAAMGAPPQGGSQDASWLIATHQTNLSEIQSGHLAAQSGHSEAVRNAGRMLASDHQSLDAKLKPVAGQLGVKLPDQPNLEQRDEMQHFKSLSGMDFDRNWAKTEADGHVKSIEATEREIQHGSSPQVKQLAQSALPVLKKHLRTLKAASTELSGSK